MAKTAQQPQPTKSGQEYGTEWVQETPVVGNQYTKKSPWIGALSGALIGGGATAPFLPALPLGIIGGATAGYLAARAKNRGDDEKMRAAQTAFNASARDNNEQVMQNVAAYQNTADTLNALAGGVTPLPNLPTRSVSVAQDLYGRQKDVLDVSNQRYQNMVSAGELGDIYANAQPGVQAVNKTFQTAPFQGATRNAGQLIRLSQGPTPLQPSSTPLPAYSETPQPPNNPNEPYFDPSSMMNTPAAGQSDPGQPLFSIGAQDGRPVTFKDLTGASAMLTPEQRTAAMAEARQTAAAPSEVYRNYASGMNQLAGIPERVTGAEENTSRAKLNNIIAQYTPYDAQTRRIAATRPQNPTARAETLAQIDDLYNEGVIDQQGSNLLRSLVASGGKVKGKLKIYNGVTQSGGKYYANYDEVNVGSASDDTNEKLDALIDASKKK